MDRVLYCQAWDQPGISNPITGEAKMGKSWRLTGHLSLTVNPRFNKRHCLVFDSDPWALREGQCLRDKKIMSQKWWTVLRKLCFPYIARQTLVWTETSSMHNVCTGSSQPESPHEGGKMGTKSTPSEMTAAGREKISFLQGSGIDVKILVSHKTRGNL